MNLYGMHLYKEVYNQDAMFSLINFNWGAVQDFTLWLPIFE
jgi:hypothetical protein